jgi:hypothetical protein
VNIKHRAELVDRQIREQPGIVDTRVVDHRVDAPEGVKCGVDDPARRAFFGDRCTTGHGLAAGLADLAHHCVGGDG